MIWLARRVKRNQPAWNVAKKGCPSDLAAVAQCVGRKDNLSDNVPKEHFVLVEYKADAFVVSAVLLAIIGYEVIPIWAQETDQTLKRSEIVAQLLDGAHVKRRCDFSDIVKALIEPRHSTVESADVP